VTVHNFVLRPEGLCTKRSLGNTAKKHCCTSNSCRPRDDTLFLWQVHAVVGVLSDDTDPMVTVMKLEKAPQETYADIGGR